MIGLGVIGWSQSLIGDQTDTSRFRIYTSPMQLIDAFSRPMATLGGEWRFASAWALSAEGGVKLCDIAPADTTWIPSEGYTARFEAKWFVSDRLAIGPNTYLSAEYRWILDRNNYSVSYYLDDPEGAADSATVDYIYDDFGVIQLVQVANVKMGVLVPLGKHLYLDMYTGLGIRWRDVSNTHREYAGSPQENLTFNHPGAWLGKLESDEMDTRLANFSMGFKFGWRF
jgi:hypothetical protein